MARPTRLLLGRWWVCIDTETTGLPDDPRSEVVEVGAGLVNPDGVVVATWSSLLAHEGDAEAAAYCAAEVHGIGQRDCRWGPRPADAARWLLHLVHGWRLVARSAPVPTRRLDLFAWNRAFDQPMLERARLLDGTGWTWGECLQLMATPLLYDAGMPRPENPDSRRHTQAPLQQAAEWLQLPSMGRPHRALADVYTTAGVLRALATGDHPGSKTWVGRGA